MDHYAAVAAALAEELSTTTEAWADRCAQSRYWLLR
jgi:hypothetical protein